MIYITLQGIIDVHSEIIEKYGGVDGIRDIGLLASAIDMPKAKMYGEYLHPTIFDKAVAYLFHIIRNPPFIDGNKRTGTIAALTFLRLNKTYIKFSKKQSIDLEELVVQTADGKTTKKQIAKFLKSCHQAQKVASITESS